MNKSKAKNINYSPEKKVWNKKKKNTDASPQIKKN